MRKVIFTPAARADFLDALDWYAEHAPTVVARMRNEVRTLTKRIAEAPLRFPPGPKDTRRALLRHFPYLVIFRHSDDAIYIIAVFHTKRDPRRWHGRI